MEFFATILGCCLGSSGVTAIILAALQRKWSKDDKADEKQDSIISGLKVLTVDRVRYLGKNYIERGWITLWEKENIKDMYAAYKALGGNGHLDTVMKEVERLDIHADELE